MGIKAALSQTTAKDHLTGQAISCQHRSQVDGFFEGLEYLIMKTQIVALHIFTNQPSLYDIQERPSEPFQSSEVFIVTDLPTRRRSEQSALMPYFTDGRGNYYERFGRGFVQIFEKRINELKEERMNNLSWEDFSVIPAPRLQPDANRN